MPKSIKASMFSRSSNKFRRDARGNSVCVYRRKKPSTPADYLRLSLAAEKRQRRGSERGPDAA